MLLCNNNYAQGQHHGGGRGKLHPKGFKEGKMYFHAIKLLKLVFPSSLSRKYMLCKGFCVILALKK